MNNIIKVNNISYGYGKNDMVIENMTFSIEKSDETVGLIGANGAGKSTLLMLLIGVYLNTGGTININGINISENTVKDVQKIVGYVFQNADSQLFMPTIYDDVAFSAINFGYDKDEVDKRVTEALKKVNILELKDRPCYKLSGGEKKLASIATILSVEPKIILMDEPTNQLDPKSRRNLINILKNFDEMKIIASHDLDMIYEIADRVILLKDGKIVADGLAKEILTNKELLESCNLELPLSLQNRF